MSGYRPFVKSKIQRLRVTDKNLKYEGSLELDEELLRAADILPGELVQVANLNNGERFETYVIKARADSGACVLNGAAARLGEVGDEIIVMSTVLLGEEQGAGHVLRRISVDSDNRMVDDGNSPRSG
ncbi:MAG: aspartate 1-decarboxylase [candidate division WOR-3 bacterium]|nr:MAG: aspartate 1-decarboxylase [candidate division WOR-3 bacterium]